MTDDKPTYRELEQEIEILRRKIKENDNDEKFNNYFASNKAIMLQINPETKQIVHANNSAIEFYGFSKAELMQKSINDLQTLPPDEVDNGMTQALKNKSNFFEFRHKVANGDIKDVQVYASPFKVADALYMVVTVYDITEQKKIALDTQLAKKDFETIFQAIGHPTIILNEKQQIQKVNEATINLTGKTESELLGLFCYNVFHNISCAAKGCPFKKMIKSEKLETNEMEVETLGGWYLVSCTPVLDLQGKLKNVIHIATDVTEQRNARIKLLAAKERAEESEKELQQKNEEYEAINEELKQSNQQLYIAKENAENAQQLLEEQNEEIAINNERLESLLRISQFQKNSRQKLLDYALQEAIGLTGSKIGYIFLYSETAKQFTLNTWSENVMHECSVMTPQNIYYLDKTGYWGEAVRQRKPIIENNFQLDNPLKKGTPKGHVQLQKFLTIPVIIANEIVAVAGVANKTKDYDHSDIRQLTLLMDSVWKMSERITLIENLKKAKKKAEESDQLKTAFLQNMSHEIRTPLNAISGFSGLLNNKDITEDKRKSFTSIIQTSSNQLVSIVSDILTISSLETKQEKINIDKVCINDIIVDLLSIFKQQSVNQNISLYAKQPLNNRQSEIYTDKTKVTQILTNLISNAMKFTHKGFIEFGYNFNADIEPAEMEFYVKDTGIGMKAELHEKIFERFRQADKSIQQNYGGTGLGLSISKGFVELLGGKIWVNSEINKGSAFYFTIPYKPVTEINKDTMQSKQKENFKTVLVAEDEEYNFLYIEELLIDLDIKLIHTKNGQETVEIAKNNPDISFILMDIKMPVMDGYTAAKIIKELKPELPIVAQSAYALEHEIKKYSGIFDDYLTKPIQEDLLIEKVYKYLNNR